MAQRRVRSRVELLLLLFFDNCPSPGGLGERNRLPGAGPEPPAKVALPAGGTRKPLEASRGCSWSRVFADFVTKPLPDASGVALGSLGVDFGELAAPKMMIFERLFWFFPRALFAARFGILFSSHFLGCWAARADGPNAKIDTPSMRKPVFFKVRASAGRATGKATDDQKRHQK